jgi:hypothetical protein
MPILSDDEFDTIFKAAAKHVRVACDREHAHSALLGCAHPTDQGDSKDVIICKLCEELLRVREIVNRAARAVAGQDDY